MMVGVMESGASGGGLYTRIPLRTQGRCALVVAPADPAIRSSSRLLARGHRGGKFCRDVMASWKDFRLWISCYEQHG